MKDIEGENYEIPDLGTSEEDTQLVLKKKLSLEERSKIVLYRIVGILTYLNVPQHTFNMSRNIEPYDVLVVSFRYVTLADHDGLLSFVRFV
jgi:MFS superfamily sulfate permease-like transporter